MALRCLLAAAASSRQFAPELKYILALSTVASRPGLGSRSSSNHELTAICSSLSPQGRLANTQQTRSYASTQSGLQCDHFVLGFLQEVLSALSIPADELRKLARSGVSDAALTAWALIKTRTHPAADKAAATTQRLSYLLSKLDGALQQQQAAHSSPLAMLLWHVAVAAAQQQLRAMTSEGLEQSVEYQTIQAMLRNRRSSGSGAVQQPSADASTVLEQHLPHLTDTSPQHILAHPAFWQLAQAAAGHSPGLAQDLTLFGYQLSAAAEAATSQLQEVQQLLGLDATQLQQQLLSKAKLSASVSLPEQRATLLAAAAGNAEVRQLLAQLQLLDMLAAVLGRSSVQLCRPVSSCELIRRLTGLGQPAPEVTPQLAQSLQGAASKLLAAVQQLPLQALSQPSVAGLMQLVSSKPELQDLSKALTAWRAEAAASGNLPVLTTLSQPEVSALSQSQAEAVGRQVMRLEAQGRLLLRKAAARQLALDELSSDDAAALAWKAHTGGSAAVEELVRLVLLQASSMTAAQLSELDAAESAVRSMSAGFELEEITSRRNTAAPPSRYVMAGIPQMELSELSHSLSAPARRGSLTSSPAATTAEVLVRSLALLLAPPHGTSSSSPHLPTSSYQAAAQQLHVLAHDLPRVISGPLQELLDGFTPGKVKDAATLRAKHEQLQAFLKVLAAELPRLGSDGSSDGSGSSSDGGGSSSSWSRAGQSIGNQEAAEGLLELLGEQDSGGVLRHAAQKRSSGAEEDHLYGWLADVHHDIDMQRYLQMEFDPALEVDIVHAPRGWQDPELFSSPAEFLEGMRPLLDRYLAAQGEEPVHEVEWQVYRDAAIAESEQLEASAASQGRAAGHSPFFNSRADEAFLRQRLEAGIPQESVLYAAAHKYLSASFQNRTWRFAQRKRMVDLLIRIADHLAVHPPRSHRGSPFSALFQKDGPPIVPRLSQQQRGSKSVDGEVYALPAGFSSRPASAQ